MRIGLFLLLCCLAVSLRAGEPRLERGVLAGALYEIALPEPWSGNVWIEAHGLRPADVPLSANVPLASPFVRQLLDQGWMVATTSYRRNGMIVEEAADDVAALIGLIREKHRPTGRVIVEGQSMGGPIVVRLAERPEPPFDGAVAVGAALQARDATEPDRAWLHVPRRPLVFLSNRSEADVPAAYVAAVERQASEAAVQPVALRVDRDGHVNVNSAERLHALELLLGWLRTGQRPASGDATRTVEPRPSSVKAIEGGFNARVVELSRIYGNLVLEAQAQDLRALGLSQGDTFTIEGPGGSYPVLWGTSYADVPRGAWVAFVTADELVMVARNFDHAARTLGLQAEGDVATVRRSVTP